MNCLRYLGDSPVEVVRSDTPGIRLDSVSEDQAGLDENCSRNLLWLCMSNVVCLSWYLFLRTKTNRPMKDVKGTQ